MKQFLSSLLVCSLLMMGGCGQKASLNTEQNEEPNIASEEQTENLVILDDLNREVTFEKQPENVAILTPTLLNLFYDVGGKATARMSESLTEIREETKELEDVGHLANINIEKLVSLKPDLVIGQTALHERFVNILEENDIPVVILEVRTYEQVIEKTRILSQIAGKEENGEKLITDLEHRVSKITENLPKRAKKIAILFANQAEVTLETEKTTAGDVAKQLGIENIVAGEELSQDTIRIPFSMEELIERDPDALLIVSWEQQVEQTLSTDPAWESIRAVKEKNVHILPPDLFTSNPGLKIDEALEYMLDIVYPELKNIN